MPCGAKFCVEVGLRLRASRVNKLHCTSLHPDSVRNRIMGFQEVLDPVGPAINAGLNMGSRGPGFFYHEIPRAP